MGWMYDSSSCGILETRCVNLVIVGVIIIRATLMRSGDNHKAFNLGVLFTALFCPQEQLKWKCHFVDEVWCFVFFPLLITSSQAVECQKIIPGFSEFSVVHRCAGQGPLWFWQLKKEVESPVRGRGPEDQPIDWDQRGKASLPLSHEVAFTSSQALFPIWK